MVLTSAGGRMWVAAMAVAVGLAATPASSAAIGTRRAQPPTGGSPTGTIVDGGRVEGADAVDQAVQTSLALFADGAARRVVLATADRFPDALSGAALAGSRGPILFTPFAEALDPRVASEIDRVTGGAGLVLILGGPAAVTEGAAQQARAAAGDQPCQAPFPASCRFAGTGREDTAALVAETVLAENGEDSALIARADNFADAITGGAFAAIQGVPVLLTPSGSANASTAAFLRAHPEITEITVLGGPAAVSEQTAADLGATDRVAGPERTATSAAIAAALWEDRGLGEGGFVLVNVRAEDAWPAALASAVASAVYDAPQLGVENPPVGLSDAVRQVLTADPEHPVQAFGSVIQVSQEQLADAVGED